MKAGKRDKLIHFERATTTQDQYGQETEEWQVAFSRWVEVWTGKGSERRQAAMEQGAQAATFGMPTDSETAGLTLKDRIVYAGSVWDIEGIAPDTPDRGEMEITAVRSV